MKTKTTLLCAVSAIALACSVWAEPPSTEGLPAVELSADANWSELVFVPDVEAEDISTTTLVVNVTADATLTFGAETSLSNLYFNIASGKTLTITTNTTQEVSATGVIAAFGGGSLAMDFAPSSGTLEVHKPTQLVLNQPCEILAINVSEDGMMTFAEGASVTIRGDISFADSKTLSISNKTDFLALDAPAQTILATTNNLNIANFVASGSEGYRVRVSNITDLQLAHQSEVRIDDVAFVYGADFTNATVTVAVTGGDGKSYSLTVAGQTYSATSDAGTVTFSGVAIPRSGALETVGYTVASDDVIVDGATTGTSLVADSTAKFHERAADPVGESGSHPEAGGFWSTAVTYNNSVASISDNTFTPTNSNGEACTLSADMVTISVRGVKFSSLSDVNEGPEGTDNQGAATIAEFTDNEVTTTNFVVLATNDQGNIVWKKTTTTADFDTSYDIDLKFNYATRKYSVSVNGAEVVLADGGASSFDICADSTVVSSVELKGSGDITQLLGIESTGYMVKDAQGNFYATVQDAINRFNKALGPYQVQHVTDTSLLPSGWKIVDKDGVLILRKIAGLIFMAF